MSNAKVQMQPDRWAALRESFMRHALPWRLGELCAGLSSARSWAKHDNCQQTVKMYLDECAHFIEWLTPDIQPPWQTDLAELKQELADWLTDWPTIWENAEQRDAIVAQAGVWSDKFLQHSGLLDPEINPR